MEQKGFVSHVSPLKRSRAKDFQYFDFTLQTGPTETRRVVCYDSGKDTEIKSYSDSGQPLKMLNFSQRESLLFPGQMDLVFNKRSKLMPAHNSEIDFECLLDQPTAPTTINDVYPLAENVIIAVKGRIQYKDDSVKTILVRGKEMDMMEQCTLTDDTATMKITLWDKIIPHVRNQGCYSLTNVRVKVFDGMKYLTTTANTVITEDLDLDFPTLTNDAFDAFFDIKTLTVEVIELVDDFKKQYACKKCNKMITAVTSDTVKIMKCRVCGSIQQLSSCPIVTSIRIAVRDDTPRLLWLTLFDHHLKTIVGSNSLEEEDVSLALLQLRNFRIQYHTDSQCTKNVFLDQDSDK